ncbi:MAG TPA: streptomycin biosynthesis protein [Pseudonocardiaceae bacterium]|jgi:ParB-like chromosome segregation protein Spo0J|nr:streptomycin biosynthesis protein [Pseudonocardiaceae bacterium]
MNISAVCAPSERVPVTALRPADSPRTAGTSDEHVRKLALITPELPPIVVHRPTMRVVDGMHRLAAARLRSAEFVEVQFVGGTAADAFVLAVELNHGGLPLTLADRTSAAARIIASHREWSDRRIAAVTGLAANTVGAIRRRLGGRESRNGELTARVGRDGKTRPGSTVAARLLASELIADNPSASLREIARAAGMSPATAGDVRARLSRGEPPITPRQRVALREQPPPLAVATARRDSPVRGDSSARRDSPVRRDSSARPDSPARRGGPVGVVDNADLVYRLRCDPSLRFTDGGRVLLRAMDVCLFDPQHWERIAASVPPHHRDAIVRLVRHSAGVWQDFADRLARGTGESSDHRASRSGGSSPLDPQPA